MTADYNFMYFFNHLPFFWQICYNTQGGDGHETKNPKHTENLFYFFLI